MQLPNSLPDHPVVTSNNYNLKALQMETPRVAEENQHRRSLPPNKLINVRFQSARRYTLHRCIVHNVGNLSVPLSDC